MVMSETKSARTRRRILDAAARVFREEGYANARLSDIAALAGIQTGSLYYHFDGREDLVAEILRLGIETSWAHVRAAVDALPTDCAPLDRLATAIRAHTLAVLEIGDYASAQARIVGQVPAEVRKGHLADQRRYGAYWNSLIEAAATAGSLRPGLDLFVARMLVLGALNWTAEWYEPKRGVSAAAIADAAVMMALSGLALPADADGYRDAVVPGVKHSTRPPLRAGPRRR
jgi:TetR/AcrR family transcriptional regulator, cholesterol catabolism regulator